MATLFYKYRSTSDMIKLLDILIRNRLFASSCEKLNDPMEGKFLYSGVSKDYKKKIKEKLDSMMICSLSTSYDNGLLWTHYANQHTGCCIEVEVTAKVWEQKRIDYLDHMVNIDEKSFPNDEDAINAILSKKSIDWEYEHEIRFIRKKGKNIKPYLTVRVRKILLGLKMEKTEKAFIKDFVEELNKGRKNSDKIVVHKMTAEEINFGYNK